MRHAPANAGGGPHQHWPAVPNGVQLVSLNLSGSLDEGPLAWLVRMAHLEVLNLDLAPALVALPAGPYRQTLRQLTLGGCTSQQTG